MDITAFLTARLDEDEAAAYYSGPARVAWLTYCDDSGRMLYTTVAASNDEDDPWVADGHDLPSPTAACIVFDPARVLAEVKAKRRVLARHHDDGNGACDGCGFDQEWGPLVEHIDECHELRDLAAPDADHPGYNPAWRVE